MCLARCKTLNSLNPLYSFIIHDYIFYKENIFIIYYYPSFTENETEHGATQLVNCTTI